MKRVWKLPNLTWVCAIAFALVGSVAGAQEWDPTPKRGWDDGYNKADAPRPIVFVHGASGAGEQFERQAQHFASNGYPPTWITAFDYSTGGGGGGGGGRGGARGARGAAGGGETKGEAKASDTAKQAPAARGARGAAAGGPDPLDVFIDEVLKTTGAKQIDLAGHSAGSARSRSYLAGDPKHAAKVAHYAHIGGGAASNPGGVASITISGRGDGGREATGTNGAKVGAMPDVEDHVMVCTSDESFKAIYTFFNDGKAPKTMEMVPMAEPLVGGYVKSYVVNRPLPEATVEVWEVAKETGKRQKQKPLVVFTVKEDGEWGPFRAKPGQYYEYVVNDKGLLHPRHIYREPYVRDDRLVYHRISSTQPGYSSVPTDRLPQLLNDKSVALVVKHQNGAFNQHLMTLKINGQDILTDTISPKRPIGGAQASTVGMYLLDLNGNGKSDMVHASAEQREMSQGFTTNCDYFIPADPNATIKIQVNKREINVPALSGGQHGHINVTFDDFR